MEQAVERGLTPRLCPGTSERRQRRLPEDGVAGGRRVAGSAGVTPGAASGAGGRRGSRAAMTSRGARAAVRWRCSGSSGPSRSSTSSARRARLPRGCPCAGPRRRLPGASGSLRPARPAQPATGPARARTVLRRRRHVTLWPVAGPSGRSSSRSGRRARPGPLPGPQGFAPGRPADRACPPGPRSW